MFLIFLSSMTQNSTISSGSTHLSRPCLTGKLNLQATHDIRRFELHWIRFSLQKEVIIPAGYTNRKTFQHTHSYTHTRIIQSRWENWFRCCFPFEPREKEKKHRKRVNIDASPKEKVFLCSMSIVDEDFGDGWCWCLVLPRKHPFAGLLLYLNNGFWVIKLEKCLIFFWGFLSGELEIGKRIFYPFSRSPISLDSASTLALCFAVCVSLIESRWKARASYLGRCFDKCFSVRLSLLQTFLSRWINLY